MFCKDCSEHVPQLDGSHDDDESSGQARPEKSRYTGKTLQVAKKVKDGREVTKVSKKAGGDTPPSKKLFVGSNKDDVKPKLNRRRKSVVPPLAVSGGKTKERKRTKCGSSQNVALAKNNIDEVTRLNDQTNFCEKRMRTGDEKWDIAETIAIVDKSTTVHSKESMSTSDASTIKHDHKEIDKKTCGSQAKMLNRAIKKRDSRVSRVVTKKRAIGKVKKGAHLEGLSSRTKSDASNEICTSDFELRLSSSSSDDDFKSPKNENLRYFNMRRYDLYIHI